jgi:hypothetical protein
VRRERHPIERRYVVDGAASGAVVMPEVHSLAISMIRSFPSISSAGSLIQGIVGCAFGTKFTIIGLESRTTIVAIGSSVFRDVRIACSLSFA